MPITPARNVLLQIGVPHRVNLPLAMMIIGLDLGYGLDFGTSKLYERVNHAKNLKFPFLVLHGASDAICPPEDGKEIAQAAKGRFVMISGADHVNLWSLESSRKQAFSAVQAFCLDALSNRTIDHAKPVEQPSR